MLIAEGHVHQANDAMKIKNTDRVFNDLTKIEYTDLFPMLENINKYSCTSITYLWLILHMWTLTESSNTADSTYMKCSAFIRGQS